MIPAAPWTDLEPFDQDLGPLLPGARCRPSSRFPTARTWEVIRECLPEDVAEWSALDVGAMDGAFSLLLAGLGLRETTAVEANDGAGDRIRRLAGHLGARVAVETWPDFRPRGTERSIDLVLATDAFRGPVFPYAWLAGLARLARRALIVEFPVEDASRDARAVRRLSTPHGPRWRVGADAVVQMLQAIGFDDVERLPYSETDFRKDADAAPAAVPPRAFVVARRSEAFGRAWRIDDEAARARGVRFRFGGLSQLSDGTPVSSATCGRPLALAFDFALDGAGGPFLATLGLYRGADLALAASAGPFVKGARRAWFDMGTCRLAPGPYEVVLGVRDAGAAGRPLLVNAYGGALAVAAGDVPCEGIASSLALWEGGAGAVLSDAGAPPNPELRIGGVELRDARGVPTAETRAGDELVADFEVEGVSAPDALVWEPFIRDAGRFFVFSAGSRGRLSLSPGMSAARVRFPALWLRPGDYVVGCHVDSRGGGERARLDYPDRPFRVLPGGAPCAGLVGHDQEIDAPRRLGSLAPGSGESTVRIDDLALITADGRRTGGFATGDELTAEVRLAAGNVAGEAVLRFQFLDPEDGVLLWGYNTSRAGISLGSLAPGEYAIRARVRALRLLPGRYLFRASAWDSDATQTNASACYDSRTVALAVIGPPDAGTGRAALATEWTWVDGEGRAAPWKRPPVADRDPPPRVRVRLNGTSGDPSATIRPGDPLVVGIELADVAEGFLPEVLVAVESDLKRDLFAFRLGRSGRRIVRLERRAVLALRIDSLPLAPGNYRARAIVLNHGSGLAIDPVRVLATSAAAPLAVIGMPGTALLSLSVATRVDQA